MNHKFIRFEPDQIREIVRTETYLHPSFDLGDLFKLLYQAQLGPHHMIPDRAAIIHDIRQEIASTDQVYMPALQDIGAGIGFYRVSLSHLDLFKDDSPVELLADLILSSRFDTDPPDGFFADAWSEYRRILCEFIDPHPDELIRIDSMLEGDRIPSHSDQYRSAHHPHYRLVHHSVLSEYIDKVFPTIEF